MMSRTVSALLVVSLLSGVTIAAQPHSNVIRPKQVDAKVNGCRVSEPGEYTATAGDLIELEYTFPVVPATMPTEVDRKTDKGAIYTSTLGIRNLIVPNMVGTQTYLFYFEAKHEGTGTAFLVVDDVEYEYRFEVSKSTSNAPGVADGQGDENQHRPPLEAKLYVEVDADLEISCQFQLSGGNDQAFQNSEYRYAVLDQHGLQVDGALSIKTVLRAILLPQNMRSVTDPTDAIFNAGELQPGQKYYLVIAVRNLIGLAEFMAP